MTKITQLAAYVAAKATDLLAIVDNTNTITKRIAVSDLATVIQSIILPSGLIQAHAGGSAPAGWLLCDGSAISRTAYASLFGAIGTTYGTGDGSTTFNIPDLRGRVVAGKDNMNGTAAGRIAAGSGASGINGQTLGASGGSEGHFHWQTVGYDGGSIYIENAGVGSGNTRVLTIDRGAIGFGHSSSASREDGTYSASGVQPTLILNYMIKT